MKKTSGVLEKDEELIWLCAFRYALGRRSYIVGVVADWIANHVGLMSNNAKRLIIKEINEANEAGDIGDEIDRATWLRLRDILVDSILNEKEDKIDEK